MNICLRLPSHPNILPFDRLVIDEIHGRVVGHTTPFIDGGTISDNLSRVFKLKWLKQLTRVVDDLNLKYGIIHQDIAAHNILVDEEVDNILLFDFNWSGCVGGVGYSEARNDIKGVIFTIYEIITQDMHFRQVPHHLQDSANVQGMTEWVQHKDVSLDHPVSAYRTFLNDWVKSREESEKKIEVYTDTLEYIDWPPLGEPPRRAVTLPNLGNPVTEMIPTWFERRQWELSEGKEVLNWERPLAALVSGRHVRADGKFEDEMDSLAVYK